MIKYLQLIFLLSFSFSAFAQRTYPNVFGYASGQQVELNDGSKVSFSGGAPFATNWQQTANDTILLGFRHNILYVDNGFEQGLFASKGYYGDYVQLRWDLARYTNQVTAFKIFRKELGSSTDSTQVANLPSDARDWRDEYSESGVMYKYYVRAEGISNFTKKFLNYIDGIGFRVPYGRISGRVTYEGGSSVQGVNIIAETDDDFAGTSVELNGTDAYLSISPPLDAPFFKLDTAFTFQGWFRPNGSTGTKTLFEKQNQYKLEHSAGILTFTVGGTQTLTLNFTEKVDTFFHVAAMRTADSVKLIALYDTDTTYIASADLTATTTANNNEFLIGKGVAGNYFKGYVDEVRIWHKSFEEEDVIVQSSLYIPGTDKNLSAYYRFNENQGSVFYDLSRTGFNFHEFHGYMSPNVNWSSIIPNSNQLAVKGITDANGNYIISGIPYATDGSNYRFVPVFGVHSFDPTEKLLFLGPGADTQSGINFIDVASFPVIGEVYYKHTYFPVEGVSIKIDGRTVVDSDGLPATTDATGKFEVEVPIGQHYVQLSKLGHGFEDNGRFPADEDELYDFQSSYTFQQPFADTTLIKVIGKMVGGPNEAAKPKGQGKSTNNIGNGIITLGTQKGFDLTKISNGTSSVIENEFYKGGVIDNTGTTTVQTAGFGGSANVKAIEIKPDQATGEFVAYLLPEKYTVTSAVAGSYTYGEDFHTTLDLTNSYPSTAKTEIDSVVTGSQISVTGETSDIVRVDSVNYDKNMDLIYRVSPSVSVTNKAGGTNFWESEIQSKDGTTVSVVDVSGVPLTTYPIFKQRNRYQIIVSVFENYVNSDNSNTTDEVPVTDGSVQISNGLATNGNNISYEIDDFGKVNYTFTAGLPKIIGDLTKAMNIIAYTGNGGSIQTPWQYNGGTFKGYVFGGLPSGNNFVTTGPNEIDMIVRDPYGSESYAWFEQGGSVTKTSSYEVLDGEGTELGVTAQLGGTVKTFAGIGAGVIIETSAHADFTVGMSRESKWIDNTTTSSTTSSTQLWQTSADKEFVGAAGDVFIGHSTNIVYGISQELTLIPEVDCVVDCVPGTTGYDIGIHKILRVNPEFGTAFQYTQNHIKNYLIPNLEDIRNIFLKNSEYHTSIFTEGSEEFGKPNDSEPIEDRVINNPDTTLTFTGSSYSFQLKIGSGPNHNWPSTDSLFVDSVQYYNNQIIGWEAILADNEKEKLSAELIKNLSFDAGVVYSSQETYEESEEKTSTHEWTIAPKLANELGFDVLGIGVTTQIQQTWTNTKTETDGTETTSTVTFGYELADSDEGDYYSIDVKQPKSHTGPVFKVRGGQSMCPFAEEEVTEFHNPGTVISEATIQRQVPVISCDNPIQINVPEDQPAIFNVELGNISESGDEDWYVISIAESTNQSGAVVKMDGTAIGNGKLVFIDAGATINKTITIEKTNPAVNDYEDIGIIFHSDCQYDPGNNQKNVADTVKLTARFKPVCSKVSVTSPDDLWLRNVNSGNELNVTIDDYNLAHTGFDKILFQYKSVSSSQWITNMSFYVNDALYASDFAAGVVAEQVSGQPSIDYIFDLGSLPDRNYNIRAQSVCANGTENFSTVLTGKKDSKRPQVFGTPQPGDGILSPGDDVMLTFDETIEAGLLLGSNFSVRGVLNGAEIRHNSAVYFDGIDDYASVLTGPNLHDKSFTIEFWTKRGDLTAGVIFDQANIELGFNGSNQFYAKLGDQTQATVETYDFTDKWIHMAFTYDYDTKQVSAYSAYDGHNAIEMEDIPFPTSFNGNGRMTIGKNTIGSHYNGFVHDLRIWETVKGYGSINSNMLVSKNGDEINLSGLWPMDEAHGAYAQDLSRSHNALLVGASWRVFPAGNARTFDGSSVHIDIPTSSSVVISNEMDFSMELYFKAPSQSNTVLFSNGKVDGTESAEALEDIWVIGIDGNNQLYAMNNGTAITLEGENFLDNQWHHLALVMKRNANTSMYVDGNLVNYEHSSNFGGLKGANMTIGASRRYSSGTPYSNFFNGSIDEFRVWKLARTTKLLEMDMTSKLTGDEKGLVAYYPFDKYDINLILQPTLVDCSYDDDTGALTGLAATDTGGAYDNVNVPNLKDARPVQNLAFSWVVNDDKLIINIDEPADIIEKTVIEFTVDRIEDLNENRLASPVTWTAYIKKNTVIWDQSVINLEKLLYEELTFDVNILNVGGVEQNYTISNLPNWLTASSIGGTLPPDSEETITFTVNPETNIGNYELSLFLGASLGYDEKLAVNIKVFEEPPFWVVDPSDFEYSMSVFGLISVDNIISTDPSDILAVFVGEEIRGVAHLEYVAPFDNYQAYLTIYSNVSSGESLDFRIWDASAGAIRGNIIPSDLVFETNKTEGQSSAPIVFEANDTFVQQLDFVEGWQWISFNLMSTDLSSTNILLEGLTASNADQIKGTQGVDDYTNENGWMGSLGALQPGLMYKLKISKNGFINYHGSEIVPSSRDISIVEGWNWLGFIPSVNMSVSEALSSLNSTSGDIIKSQLQFAVYEQGLGWLGSLKTLKPGTGYMVNAATVGTLTYPDRGLANGRTYVDNGEIESQWSYDPGAYSDNMTVVAELKLAGNTDLENGYLVGAFVGDDIRGIAEPIYVSNKQSYRYFLTIGGQQSGDSISFRVIDPYDQVHITGEKINYKSNLLVGSTDNPFELNLDQQSMITEIVVYPNPFNETIDIKGELNHAGNLDVSIVDLTGKKVKSLYSAYKDKGKWHLSWDGNNQLGRSLVHGIYVIRVKTGTTVSNIKVIKE